MAIRQFKSRWTVMNQVKQHAHSNNINAALGLYFTLALVWYFVPHPIVIIALGLLPFCLLVVIRFPFLMVLFFVIFSFFRIHEVFPPLYSLKIPLLFSLASIFTLSWHLGLTKKIVPYWRKEHSVLSVFFILVALGVIFATNLGVALTYFKGIYWKIALMTYAITW